MYSKKTTSAHAVGGARSMGAILIEVGRLSTAGVEAILRLQEKRGLRFGEAAVELGLLNDDDIHYALANQFDYPYLSPDDQSLSHELAAAYQPFSSVVEQLRALRSELILRWFDAEAQRKALAIVSPGKGEGRSFIAANLAIVFSQLGERTLLIDADLRSPCQHELFKLGNHPGLSELLAGRAGVEAVVRVPSLLGLSVLQAGTVPPNPQELLGRPAFAEMLHTLGHSFDVIIIDTPATRDFADAKTIAVRAKGALLVARNDQTSLPDLSELVRSLQQSGATLVGSVLNQGWVKAK